MSENTTNNDDNKEPRRVALFVGINEYDDPKLPNLDNAANDAYVLSRFFIEHGYECTRLNTPKVTVQTIKEKVTVLTRELDANDVFLFFFAGHGGIVKQGGQSFQGLFASDEKFDVLSRGACQLIVDKDIPSCDSRCQWLMIIDACRTEIPNQYEKEDAQ